MTRVRNLLNAATPGAPGRGDIGPLELLVLQGTPFCNLDCSYCYLPDRDDQSRMDIAVVERALERVLQAGIVEREFTVVWHAGEPLVLGVDYYERAIERIRGIVPDDVEVSHSIQTNGVLIDSHWCDFFKRHRIRLGLSIDGPAEIHDVFRKTRNGKGTHARLSRKLELLHSYQVPFHVIAVLTAESIRQPEAMFEYFSALGIEQLCFNVEEIEGRNLTSKLLEQDRYASYSRFLTRFHELREQHQAGLRIREIDGAIEAIACWREQQDAAGPRPQENTPFKIVNVDVSGNFCTFSPELLGSRHARYGEFQLGNLFTTSIDECMQHPHYRKIAAAVADGVKKCRSECDYFDLCGGGSPSNKLAENNRLDSSETAFCRLQRKACVDVALNLLEQNLGICAEV